MEEKNCCLEETIQGQLFEIIVLRMTQWSLKMLVKKNERDIVGTIMLLAGLCSCSSMGSSHRFGWVPSNVHTEIGLEIVRTKCCKRHWIFL